MIRSRSILGDYGARLPAVIAASLFSLLFLDGQLGPLSFTLRRATAFAVLAVIAATRWTRGGQVAAPETHNGAGGVRVPRNGSNRASPSPDFQRSTSTSSLRRRFAGLAGVVAAVAIVARAPSVPIALVGFVVALAAIDMGLGPCSAGAWLPAGLVAACLSYVAIRFAVDLVPQGGWGAETVAWAGSRYINNARGFDTHPSNTALGGPTAGLAVLYLLWAWRRAGGIGRAIAAIVIPLAWFAVLPAVTPEVAAGPIAAFSRGAYHGLFWLGVAGFIGVAGRRQPGAAALQSQESRPGAAAPQVIGAGIAAALAGVCLVGTAYIQPAAGRSVRVYNNGGLDWDRPVYGRFGAFSGGMFGTWPVYSRAEGYDFDVIDKAANTQSNAAPQPMGATTAKAASTAKNGSSGAPVSRASLQFKAEPTSKDGADRTAPARAGSRSKAEPRSNDGADGAAPARAGSQSKAEPRSKEGSAGASPSHADSPSRATPLSRVAAPAKAGAPAKDAPPPDTIEPADLVKTQILVLINSPKVWDERERRTIYDFVARGGSLLVLGDHTDVFGLMRGFNSLLGPLGIQFRFDSAYKARENWRGCQAAAADAVACGWDDENPGVAVGASLELSGSARPLLVGRYGFSDNGVRENVMGSYLGNYHYDPGERLGDVVLVATATYGRGRVVVWGDTSAFQGVSSHYPAVVGPMLAWLSRPAGWTDRPPVRAAAALGLLATIAWLWLSRGGTRQAAVIAVGLLLGLAVPWCLGLPHREARVTIADDMVLFDRSHLPASGHYNARVNPIGPLYTNLLRAGFRVTELEDWDPTAIARAKGVAFVAPQRSFTAAEVKDLLNAERRGAVVILTAGQPDSAGARRLLDAHGLALLPRPLGTVSSADPSASRRERETRPRFLDAWPIVTSERGNPADIPGVEVIYRHGDDAVTLFRREGKGGLLMISDTRFFSDMNVEDMTGYWLGNLALIHDLFQRYLGADPDAVQPLFRSPVKPQ
ncbi:MAG: DUF4350 domain-containing protein [Isosphaerales bacterium]